MKFCNFNVENLFISHAKDVEISKPSDLSFFEKDRKKCEELAKVIKKIDADIFLLNEIGGADSLDFFVQDYLGGTYTPSLLKGNSDRGIEIAYLIKKNFPYKFSHLSNKERPLDFLYPDEKKNPPEELPTYYMSRDISELQVQDDSGETKLIILGVHLKSQRDMRRDDPRSILRREAEFICLLNFYKQRAQEFPQAGIILSGDFNGAIFGHQKNIEFNTLANYPELQDLCQLKKYSALDAHTYLYFNEHKHPVPIQLDYIFLTPYLAEKLDTDNSFIYRFNNYDPQKCHEWTEDQFRKLPSDHFPMVASFKKFLD